MESYVPSQPVLDCVLPNPPFPATLLASGGPSGHRSPFDVSIALIQRSCNRTTRNGKIDVWTLPNLFIKNFQGEKDNIYSIIRYLQAFVIFIHAGAKKI